MEYFLISLITISMILIPNSTGIPQTVYKQYIGLFVIALMIVWWTWKHNKFLAAFLAWAIIRMILPDTQPRAMVNISNLTMGVMVYLAIQYVKINKTKLFNAIAIITLIQIAVVFLQKLNLFMFWNASQTGSNVATGSVYGLFGNSNWTGVFIAMSLPIFFNFKKGWVGVIAGLIALLILDSQFAIAAGISGVVFYLFMKYKNMRAFIIASILLITFLFSFAILTGSIHISDGDRFIVWDKVLKLSMFNGSKEWGCNFVQGFGLGSTYMILPKITEKLYISKVAWFQVHNEYLQVLFEYGLIGFSIIIGLIYTMFRTFNPLKIIEYSCMTALLIDAFGFFVFRTSPMGFMGMMFLGLIDRNDNAILL